MRICLVTTWFPSKERPYVAPFVYNFAKSLADSGIEVSVITVLGKGDDAVAEQDSISIHRVNRKLALVSALKLVDRIKPDLLHVHAPNYFGSLAILLAWLKKIPIIATVYRAEIDTVNKPLLPLFRKLALRRFHRVIALSYFSKSLAVKAGVDETRLSVIYNSCDESLFFPKDKLYARTKLNLPEDKNIILFVGNLIELKGIYTLIESLRILHSNSLDYLALILGRGSQAMQQKLDSMINEYHLNDMVRFLGWHRQDELPNFYDAADVFILPSMVEGHSIALLEAMASGLPIIASDIEGNRESIQEGVNGLLFKAGDETELARKIVTIFNDSKAREHMSSINPKIYSLKFSTRAQVKNYLDVYSTLLKKENRDG